MWETATRRQLGPPLRRPGGGVDAAFWAPNDQLILTISSLSAQLWEPAGGRPLGPPFRDNAGNPVFSDDGTLVLTFGTDKTVRLRPVPIPVQGDAERLILWSQVLTGTELDANQVIQVLDATTWQERRQRLKELGGPP